MLSVVTLNVVAPTVTLNVGPPFSFYLDYDSKTKVQGGEGCQQAML
jgi:hypothetical protein